jgi:primosomal protein N' (replication factor Y) (superfamily II helicase)
MKNAPICTVNIIPLVRISSLNDGIFSYTTTTNLPIGSLVEVPLGKGRVVKGVTVTAPEPLAQLTPETLKPIRLILSPALLTPQQIQLAHFIAKEYFASIGIVLRLFLPPDLKTRILPPTPSKEAPKTIQLTPDQKKASLILLKSKKAIFLGGPPSSGKTEVLIETAKKILQKKKQILFLLPEIALTPHTIDRLVLRLGQEVVLVFHSALGVSERKRVWQKIASGNPCVVVGSRSSLFLPFANLGLVIVDEEHDDSHKSALKSPRYDARSVAEQLAHIHTARAVLCSATPRAETVFRIEQKDIAVCALPPLPNERRTSSKTALELIDMRLLHWKNKQKRLAPPVFSEELIARLRETLTRKEQALILVSRQGMNAFTICAHCKNIFRCPKCERALVPQRSGHFLCLGGHFRTPAFPKCPTCGGLQFVGHGVGTQKVEEELARLFPYSKIARLDAQAFKKRVFREKIFQDVTHKNVDILIGTQMIAKGWNLPHLSLIGVLDADAFFGMNDYSADARTAQLFFQAQGRLGRVGNVRAGTFLIQTYHTDRPLFAFLGKDDYAGFLKNEMETRQALTYPPYCRLLHIVGKHTSEAVLKAQGLAIFKSLALIADTGIKISRPAKSQKRPMPDGSADIS